ncbi:hypothetical protein P3594_07350 [Vibrio parahaemolyticus]|nr:hypothetical protein [Vibrio parahaemolyticus]MDF5080092.1 hypothetical protein [Vibrio parahaemolyticus]MDF5101122.1 hypothetical protein [Vibrio parahaemolyticus]MDF5259510.1 hypothetical protein [Vibrio parahaemolyticus]
MFSEEKMEYCIKKIEKALLEYFRSNLERLSDKEIDLIDIGVFPWHSKIEVSFYESGDSASLDDIAAWELYDFSSMKEGHWNLGLDVAEDLSKEWDKSRDILPCLFDFSSAVTSDAVRAAIGEYKLSNNFCVQILDPDKPNSKNYCEW